VRVTTNAGSLIDYVHDALGRVVETRVATAGPDRVTRTAYDAANRVVSITDPDGRIVRATYDSAGNLATSTDADGRTTSFTYDTGGRVTSATDPLGHISSTTYDTNGRPLSTTANGSTTSQTYDARGQVATATDAFGVTTSMAYDSAGRLTSVSRPGTPTVTIARTPTADGEQVVVTRGSEVDTTTTDRYGRVVSAAGQGGSTTVSYDPVTGLPASTSATFRGQTRTTQATYTNTGDPASLWVNGQQRQSAARTVPPGNAWFPSSP
jgi:YD repeat-containing protein